MVQREKVFLCMDADVSTFAVYLTLGCKKIKNPKNSLSSAVGSRRALLQLECVSIELPRKNLTHTIPVSVTL